MPTPDSMNQLAGVACNNLPLPVPVLPYPGEAVYAYLNIAKEGAAYAFQDRYHRDIINNIDNLLANLNTLYLNIARLVCIKIHGFGNSIADVCGKNKVVSNKSVELLYIACSHCFDKPVLHVNYLLCGIHLFSIYYMRFQ